MFFAKRSFKPDALAVDGDFILATLHRAENTDDPVRLESIVKALNDIHVNVARVVLPLHPRTRKAVEEKGFQLRVDILDPVGYLEMIWLLNEAGLVVTDSGGLQKEAFFFGKACVTLRDETEWIELVEIGANELVGADAEKIRLAVQAGFGRTIEDTGQLYGGGHAAERIVAVLN